MRTSQSSHGVGSCHCPAPTACTWRPKPSAARRKSVMSSDIAKLPSLAPAVQPGTAARRRRPTVSRDRAHDRGDPVSAAIVSTAGRRLRCARRGRITRLSPRPAKKLGISERPSRTCQPCRWPAEQERGQRDRRADRELRRERRAEHRRRIVLVEERQRRPVDRGRGPRDAGRDAGHGRRRGCDAGMQVRRGDAEHDAEDHDDADEHGQHVVETAATTATPISGARAAARAPGSGCRASRRGRVRPRPS